MAEGVVAFRADASVEIGAGHVMRCLTLADALRGRGARCLFLCRPHDGHLLELVAARGHEAVALPARRGETASDAAAPVHAHWLGTGWASDAADSRDALAGRRPDWLVVDHYALERRWERAMRPHCRRLLVIDDLADRPHDCDLLLDQNLGRRAEDYRGLLPAGAQALAGPRHALLRPQFAALRAESLARRQHPRLERLLVSMGGVDKDDVTGAVLDALHGCDLPRDLQVTVAMGPQAPWRAQVQTRAAAMPRPTRVLVGAGDMARLMAEADLAVGAAGGSAWERCAVALPSLVVVVADNQRFSAAALDAAGAALLLGEVGAGGWRERLAAALSRLADPDARRAMAAAAARVTDGLGAQRVVQAMLQAGLDIRPAAPDDAEAIWEWRHAGGAVRFYRQARTPPLGEHRDWFARALADPRRLLLVVSGPEGAFAHVRFDRPQPGAAEAEVAVCLSQAARGKGLSLPALGLALDHAAGRGIRRFTAFVHEQNAASLRLFSGLGFVQDGQDGPFLRLLRTQAPGD